ncbi:hypothetical protein [Planktothrix mougeotii]|uniref:Uncharacterized protein n=1 Tax=Planktothrix mougeotii LEGE 06226 TaxID=1828728 RepID=A0ABR9UC68_9CYAN|nr:hypothetical protein [Planktothrix mougeotii]MBE9144058.1 hypothetical protein [Planktothrix mougeotii LEGE 06226]
MGSFDVTCAFSRAGIRIGDEVLLVVTYQNNWDTYTLMSDCHQYKFSNQQLNPQPQSPFQFIGVGLYDDYGAIEDFNHEVKEGDWWEYQFMVHRTIAETLLDRPLNLAHLEDDVIQLISMAYQLRIQLRTGFLGNQFVNLEEMEMQRILRIIITTQP